MKVISLGSIRKSGGFAEVTSHELLGRSRLEKPSPPVQCSASAQSLEVVQHSVWAPADVRLYRGSFSIRSIELFVRPRCSYATGVAEFTRRDVTGGQLAHPHPRVGVPPDLRRLHLITFNWRNKAIQLHKHFGRGCEIWNGERSVSRDTGCLLTPLNRFHAAMWWFKGGQISARFGGTLLGQCVACLRIHHAECSLQMAAAESRRRAGGLGARRCEGGRNSASESGV